MADSNFTPIETQEQFDAAISSRLQRERETAAKRYEGWTSPEELQNIRSGYDTQLKGLQDELKAAKTTHAAELRDRDQTIARYETDSVKTRVAMELGLPYGMASRLTGGTEEEIRADAEALKGIMRSGSSAQPGRSTEPAAGGSNDTRDLLRSMVSNLNLGG